MNREEYLLTKLAEEASEVAQIALKAQQFGMNEIRKEQPLTNSERIHIELNDLNAIIELLNEEYNLNYKPSLFQIVAKKEKLKRYYQYSVSLGKVVE